MSKKIYQHGITKLELLVGRLTVLLTTATIYP